MSLFGQALFLLCTAGELAAKRSEAAFFPQ